MGFLLDFLSFLNLITTSLPLITLRAYWPLNQSIEFTNSSPKLPRSIYFFFTFFYSYVFTTSFFGSLSPFTSSLPLFYSCGPASHQSCHFNLLGLFPYSFTVFLSSPSLLLGFFCYWALCHKWTSTPVNIGEVGPQSRDLEGVVWW